MLPAGARRVVAAGLPRGAVGAAQALRRSQAGVAEQGRRQLCAGEARSRSGRGSAEPRSAAACMRLGFELGRHRHRPMCPWPMLCPKAYTMGRWPGQTQFGSPFQPPKAHSTTRVQKGRSSRSGGVRAPWLSSTSPAQKVHASTLAIQRSGARDLAREEGPTYE